MTTTTNITSKTIGEAMPADVYTAVKLLGYTTRDGKDIDKNIINESIAKGLNEYYDAVDTSYEVDDAGNKTIFSEKLLRNKYPGMYASNVVDVEKRNSFTFITGVAYGEIDDFKLTRHLSLDKLVLESLVLNRLHEPSSHGFAALYFAKLILDNVERDGDVRPELSILFSMMDNNVRLSVIDISDFLQFITKLSVEKQSEFCRAMSNYRKRDLLVQYSKAELDLLWHIVNKHHSYFEDSVVKEYLGFIFNIKYIEADSESKLDEEYYQLYEKNVEILVAEYKEKLVQTVHESGNVFLRKRAELTDKLIERL